MRTAPCAAKPQPSPSGATPEAFRLVQRKHRNDSGRLLEEPDTPNHMSVVQSDNGQPVGAFGQQAALMNKFFLAVALVVTFAATAAGPQWPSSSPTPSASARMRRPIGRMVIPMTTNLFPLPSGHPPSSGCPYFSG